MGSGKALMGSGQLSIHIHTYMYTIRPVSAVALVSVQRYLCYGCQFSARTSVTCCSKVLCFTVRDKVVSRWIYANFTALNLLYVKDLIVNGLYSSHTPKSSTETEGVVNKETYGAIKGTNTLLFI